MTRFRPLIRYFPIKIIDNQYNVKTSLSLSPISFFLSPYTTVRRPFRQRLKLLRSNFLIPLKAMWDRSFPYLLPPLFFLSLHKYFDRKFCSFSCLSAVWVFQCVPVAPNGVLLDWVSSSHKMGLLWFDRWEQKVWVFFSWRGK